MTVLLACTAIAMSLASYVLGTRTIRFQQLGRGYLLIAFSQLLTALERERAGCLPDDEYRSLLDAGQWLLCQPDSELYMGAAVRDLWSHDGLAGRTW